MDAQLLQAVYFHKKTIKELQLYWQKKKSLLLSSPFTKAIHPHLPMIPHQPAI